MSHESVTITTENDGKITLLVTTLTTENWSSLLIPIRQILLLTLSSPLRTPKQYRAETKYRSRNQNRKGTPASFYNTARTLRATRAGFQGEGRGEGGRGVEGKEGKWRGRKGRRGKELGRGGKESRAKESGGEEEQGRNREEGKGRRGIRRGETGKRRGGRRGRGTAHKIADFISTVPPSSSQELLPPQK